MIQRLSTGRARNRGSARDAIRPGLRAGLAVLCGLVIAILPVRYSAALFGGGILLIAAVFEPLVGLAIMLAVGLAEPLLSAAGLLPVPFSQVAFLLFAGAWILRGMLRREIHWPHLPLTLFFFVFLAAGALSVYTAQPVSPKDAATELWKWLQMYLIAGIVAASTRHRFRLLLAILLGIGLAEAGLGVWQFQFRGHGPDGFRIMGEHWRAYGTLEQPNPFGGLMGLIWPVAAVVAAWGALNLTRSHWPMWRRSSAVRRYSGSPRPLGRLEMIVGPGPVRDLLLPALALATALGTLLALFLSFSRGAWVGAAAAAGVMVVFWPHRRWVGLLLAGGGLAAALALYGAGRLPASIAGRFADVGDFAQVYDVRGVHINDTNFAIVERLAHWQAALNMANAHPLFGVGFGNFEPAYDVYRLAAWRYGLGHAHNVYLNVLAETGVVGLAGYLMFWSGIIAITIKVISRASSRRFDLQRALAVGLLGCWAHLAVHQILDNLYVGNIPLYLGALFGLLCILHEQVAAGDQVPWAASVWSPRTDS